MVLERVGLVGATSSGAAWSDPHYMFTYANVQSPFDRSPTNGIRLISYTGGMPEDASKPVELLARDYTKEKPVTDEVFDIYRRRFVYDPLPLNAKLDAAPGTSDYRLDKVTFDAAYGQSKMLVYVYLPLSGTPPYQTVIVFPGSSAIGLGANRTGARHVCGQERPRSGVSGLPWHVRATGWTHLNVAGLQPSLQRVRRELGTGSRAHD